MRLLTSRDFAVARVPVQLDNDELQLWFFPPDPDAVADTKLRALLGAHLGCAQTDLVFGRAEHGKPFLSRPAGLEFNLSHSRDALLIGLSRAQALGVDIETLQRERPALEIARRFFTASETRALSLLESGPPRNQAFLRLWSAKEAVVKALGRGLGFGLAELEFVIDARGQPSGLNVIGASAGTPPEWQIIGLQPCDGYVGALAWRGPPRTVRAFKAIAD